MERLTTADQTYIKAQKGNMMTTDEDVGLREGGIICKRMVGIRWNGSEWRGIGLD
jgi:hypothetical protein